LNGNDNDNNENNNNNGSNNDNDGINSKKYFNIAVLLFKEKANQKEDHIYKGDVKENNLIRNIQ